MVSTLLTITALIPLSVMMVTDLRNRSIGVVWLAAFYIIVFSASVAMSGLKAAAIQAALNFAFLSLLFGFLYLYIGVFRKKRYGGFGNAMGLGDILFLPAFAPLFPLREFVVFLIASFCFTLALWSVLWLCRRAPKTIPLVSAVGICFVPYALIVLI